MDAAFSANRNVRIVTTSSPSIHVLHVVDALSLGGAERMLVEIANRTCIDGHRVSVCVTRSGIELASRLDRRIEVIVLGRKRRTDVQPLVRLARWTARNAVDVVHCHGRSSFSLLAMLKASGLYRRPLVLHDHLGVQLHPAVPIWFRVAKRYLSAYAAVDAEQLRWADRAGVPTNRMYLIPNALDMAASRQTSLTGERLPDRDGRSRLIFVGGLRREKAIDVLLDAIARVKTPAILYVVGGDADAEYARQCRERATNPDVSDRVIFLGRREDALALAATADLAVHSARSESGPLVLAEYVAIGVPFVSTSVGGVANALAEANVGNFVPPDNPDALAHAIDQMLAQSQEDRQQLGRAWRETAMHLFDISTAMPHWYRLYAQVMRQ